MTTSQNKQDEFPVVRNRGVLDGFAPIQDLFALHRIKGKMVFEFDRRDSGWMVLHQVAHDVWECPIHDIPQSLEDLRMDDSMNESPLVVRLIGISVLGLTVAYSDDEVMIVFSVAARIEPVVKSSIRVYLKSGLHQQEGVIRPAKEQSAAADKLSEIFASLCRHMSKI